MDATRCLCEEHDLILQALDHLEALLEQARQRGEGRREVFQPFIELLSGFTVGAHFCKEERALFPLLRDRGVPAEGSPLAALEQEHEVARALTRDFAAHVELLDHDGAAALSGLLEDGGRLVELLRGHIARADHCAFRLATGLLRDADPRETDRLFAAAERQAGDPETLRRWRALAAELARGEAGQDPRHEAGRG